MKNYYKEPKNVKKYKIVEIVDHGETYYVIYCFYFEKRYVFWGEVIEKKAPFKKLYFGFHDSHYSTAIFRSVDEAQKELNAFKTNSVKVIKEIVVG